MNRERVKQGLEAADRMCAVGMSTILGTAFASIGHAGSADPEEVDVLGSSTKIIKLFPYFWGLLAARTLIGVGQAIITIGVAKNEQLLEDESVNDEDEQHHAAPREQPAERGEGEAEGKEEEHHDQILVEDGSNVGGDEQDGLRVVRQKSAHQGHLKLNGAHPVDEGHITAREAKYTKWRVGVDLALARIIPTILIGVAVLGKKEPADMFLATEACVFVRQLLTLAFNSYILAEKQPEDRRYNKLLTESAIGSLTTASLGVTIYGVFIRNPEHPASAYTILGMSAAGVQLAVQTIQLVFLARTCRASIGEEVPHFSRQNSDVGRVDVAEAGDLLGDQEAQQDQHLVQSPSMWQNLMADAKGAAKSLFRVHSGVQTPDGVRFVRLAAAPEGKQGDVLLTSLSGTQFFAPGRGGDGRLVASESRRGLNIQQVAKYGTMGKVEGGELLLKMPQYQTQAGVQSLWTRAEKPSKKAPAGGGDGAAAAGGLPRVPTMKGLGGQDPAE